MEQHPPITRAHVRIASAILTLIGLAYLYHALQLPLGEPRGTGVGATPIAIGVLWVAFGIYATLRTPESQVRDGEVGTWPTPQMAKQLGLAIVLCIGFIALLPLFGMSLTSGLFLLFIARVAGARWRKSLFASIVLAIFFWLIFVRLLQVSLPEGSIISLLSRS
jgi:putative tricarboxylic transport membrane protein